MIEVFNIRANSIHLSINILDFDYQLTLYLLLVFTSTTHSKLSSHRKYYWYSNSTLKKHILTPLFLATRTSSSIIVILARMEDIFGSVDMFCIHILYRLSCLPYYCCKRSIGHMIIVDFCFICSLWILNIILLDILN